MQIRGTTDLYLVIGDPVAQVKSPALYSDWCQRSGVDAIFLPFQIARDHGQQVFDALRHVPNLRGMIVTIPFKPLAAGLCAHLTTRAQAAGAVNVIRLAGDGGWHGDALDGFGCVAALQAKGRDPKGARVRIVGAGGAGASVAAALAEAGAATISIGDLDRDRAGQLAARLAASFPHLDTTAEPLAGGAFDIVVNASPAGMRPDDPLPLDPAMLGGQPVVIEMIMQPARTPLFALAEQNGCPVIEGRQVLDGQFQQTLRFLELA